MSLFGGKSEPVRPATLDHLIHVQSETNNLLRELIVLFGATPRTPKTLPVGVKPAVRGAEDVVVTGRKTVIEREWKDQERQTAPWRSGPGSSQTSPNDGSEQASEYDVPVSAEPR